MASRETSTEGREAIISVRLSPREEEDIREAAAKRGEPVSAFVREAALGVARPRRNGPSWSATTTTVAPGGTVIPRYTGTVVSSQPAPAQGTAGTATEPIERSR
jgi:hypothetical protein